MHCMSNQTLVILELKSHTYTNTFLSMILQDFKRNHITSVLAISCNLKLQNNINASQEPFINPFLILMGLNIYTLNSTFSRPWVRNNHLHRMRSPHCCWHRHTCRRLCTQADRIWAPALSGLDRGICRLSSISCPRHHLSSWRNSRHRQTHSRRCCCHRHRLCRLCTQALRTWALEPLALDRGIRTFCSTSCPRDRLGSSRNNRHRQTHTRRCCLHRHRLCHLCTQADRIWAPALSGL